MTEYEMKVCSSLTKREMFVCRVDSESMVAFGKARYATPVPYKKGKRQATRALQHRFFVHVSSEMLEGQTNLDSHNPVKGTEHLHCIRPVSSAVGYVMTRRLGRACEFCMANRFDDCINMEMCGPWSEHRLELESEGDGEAVAKLMADNNLLADDQSQLIEGMNVAMQPVDEDEAFMLMRLVKGAFELERGFTHAALELQEGGYWINDALHGSEWITEALEEHQGGWGKFIPGEEVVIGLWYRHLGGSNYELCDAQWAKTQDNTTKEKAVGFPYVVCSVDQILKWGFPMTEASYAERKDVGRHKGKVANLRMYHLHHNIESDIESVMELNGDDDDGSY